MNMFRSIFFSALVVGVICGALYGVFQQLQINPIIYAAEGFEVADQTSGESHSHEHEHEHGHWSPADGLQRMGSTMGANILIAIGFSLSLISAMLVHNEMSRRAAVTWKSGMVWGLGLLASFFIAPALLGIHPEIPGTVAESLAHRQVWWSMCAAITAAGLLVLYYAKSYFRFIGLGLLVLPHAIGAPIPEELTFMNQDPEAVRALSELSTRFVMMTSIGMVLFFVPLGALSGIAASRLALRN